MFQVMPVPGPPPAPTHVKAVQHPDNQNTVIDVISSAVLVNGGDTSSQPKKLCKHFHVGNVHSSKPCQFVHHSFFVVYDRTVSGETRQWYVSASLYPQSPWLVTSDRIHQIANEARFCTFTFMPRIEICFHNDKHIAISTNCKFAHVRRQLLPPPAEVLSFPSPPPTPLPPPVQEHSQDTISVPPAPKTESVVKIEPTKQQPAAPPSMQKLSAASQSGGTPAPLPTPQPQDNVVMHPGKIFQDVVDSAITDFEQSLPDGIHSVMSKPAASDGKIVFCYCGDCTFPSRHKTFRAVYVVDGTPVRSIRVFAKLFQTVVSKNVSTTLADENQTLLDLEVQRLQSLQPLVAEYVAVADLGSAGKLLLTKDAGISLDLYLAEFRNTSTKLSLAHCQELCSAVVELAARLHRKKFGHLDVKPQNIVLSLAPNGGLEVRFVDLESTRYITLSAATTTSSSASRLMSQFWAHPRHWQWYQTATGTETHRLHESSGPEAIGKSAAWDVYSMVLVVVELLAAQGRFHKGTPVPVCVDALEWESECRSIGKNPKPDLSDLLRLPSGFPTSLPAGQVASALLSHLIETVKFKGDAITIDDIFGPFAFFRPIDRLRRVIQAAAEDPCTLRHLSCQCSGEEERHAKALWDLQPQYLKDGHPFVGAPLCAKYHCLRIMRNFLSHSCPSLQSAEAKDDAFLEHCVVGLDGVIAACNKVEMALYPAIHVSRRFLLQALGRAGMDKRQALLAEQVLASTSGSDDDED